MNARAVHATGETFAVRSLRLTANLKSRLPARSAVALFAWQLVSRHLTARKNRDAKMVRTKSFFFYDTDWTIFLC
jgi:hypothetical protein